MEWHKLLYCNKYKSAYDCELANNKSYKKNKKYLKPDFAKKNFKRYMSITICCIRQEGTPFDIVQDCAFIY